MNMAPVSSPVHISSSFFFFTKNVEYKARKVECAFNDGYTLHRSKGVEEGIVKIEDYLNKYVKRHVLKLMKKLVKNGDNCKFQLNLGVEFVSRKDLNNMIEKPIWSENHVGNHGRYIP